MAQYHIRINGRPICEHTASVAGMEDRSKVRGQPTCGQGDPRGAMEAVDAWKAAHPAHDVAAVAGRCPHVV